MSAYRYVVFPQTRQPTVDEVRELKSFAGALANHFAWGTCRQDGRLAAAFERRGFDHLRAIDAGFDSLVRRWEVRGCELVDHLAFVKDAAALKPVAVSPLRNHDGRETLATLRRQEHLAARQAAAQEAVGRSLLAVERTLQRYAAWERFAMAGPYLLMAAAIVMTLLAGVYVHRQMSRADREPRQETIERVLDDPLETELKQSLKR